MRSIDEADEALLQIARKAAAFAYCPYSQFPVGAAVETELGIFTGCNIENASYGLCICAERVAIFTALAAGISNVRPATFALYAFPGGFVWVSSFIAIGYFLGAEWEQLRHRFESGAIAGVVILAVVGVVVWLLNRRRAS